MELTKHFANQFIIKVNFALDLLNVDWLQEISSLAVFLISGLEVIHNVTLVIHGNVLEALIVLSIIRIIKEKVLLLLLNSFECLEELLGVVGFILFSQGFKLDENIYR